LLVSFETLNPRTVLKKWLRNLGYDFHALPLPGLTLRDLEFDLSNIISDGQSIVFDVGANKGQTIELVRRALPRATIVAFEPNPQLARLLKEKYSDVNVMVEACAVGAVEGDALLHAMENNELSSLLDLSRSQENPFSETQKDRDVAVAVVTVDSYVSRLGIDRMDLLKIDTQGFDLEVLRGAVASLDRKIIGAILVEVNFIEMYMQQCSFGDIERFLAARGYGLVNLYEVVRSKTCIQWATALFAKQA
jgi:FkbM family methyltransferase